MNLLDTIISTVIVISLPIGTLIPETTIRCGGIFGGAYVNDIVYVCDLDDGNNEFYKHHEIGHRIWNKYLTTEDKETYIKSYQSDKKRGIKRFYRHYEMSDPEEDFCTNYSLMVINEKVNIYIKKRQKIIKSMLR